MEIVKDLAAKKLYITREIKAPVEKVWNAWTESELLDKWWAPRPWKAETKTMDFSAGGKWLYAMVSPEGQKHWSLVNFTAIEQGESFSATSIFSDEHGTIIAGFPKMHWVNKFIADGSNTRLETQITFDNDTDLKTIIEMGFEGGFTMGLNQLDELLGS